MRARSVVLPATDSTEAVAGPYRSHIKYHCCSQRPVAALAVTLGSTTSRSQPPDSHVRPPVSRPAPPPPAAGTYPSVAFKGGSQKHQLLQ